MGASDYLYHYTNVDVLALILKNQTIRFNSLDKMDDLQEQETADVENIGQFCYVSSWTEDEMESIPMWNMYTDMNRGVRIALRKNPFILHDNHIQGIEKVLKEDKDWKNIFSQKSLIPYSEMLSKNFYCIPAFEGNILYKMQYTDNSEKLYPKIVNKEEKIVSVALGNIGKFKNIHWKFQKEWRYIFMAIPIFSNLFPKESSNDTPPIVMESIIQGKERQPFPYYDLTIAKEAFSEMEITMSPRIVEGDRIIIEDLIEKYNPLAMLKHSRLVGLI